MGVVEKYISPHGPSPQREKELYEGIQQLAKQSPLPAKLALAQSLQLSSGFQIYHIMATAESRNTFIWASYIQLF